MAALDGKDVSEDTRLREKSIIDAKKTLETEKENINSLLGSMDGAEYSGPRAPKLPEVHRSMDAREFTVKALESLGAAVSSRADNLCYVESDGRKEHIRFDDDASPAIRSTLYAPGSAAFSRLVDQIVASGVYYISDLDERPDVAVAEIAKKWIASFDANPVSLEIEAVNTTFEGNVIVRTQASVAHDSYERLVEVPCSPSDTYTDTPTKKLFGPVPHTIEDPTSIGINVANVAACAEADPAIAEFSRFYLERRTLELKGAGDDERKRKRLEDEFTPRLSMTIVGLEGNVHRRAKLKVKYRFDERADYNSQITVVPHTGEIAAAPRIGRCAISGTTICIGKRATC